jgi:hypothetical protein
VAAHVVVPALGRHHCDCHGAEHRAVDALGVRSEKHEPALAKAKNVPDEHVGTYGYGDVWTWTAIDAETKLVPSWLVGERTTEDCPAMAAGVDGRIWSVTDIASLLD